MCQICVSFFRKGLKYNQISVTPMMPVPVLQSGMFYQSSHYCFSQVSGLNKVDAYFFYSNFQNYEN